MIIGGKFRDLDWTNFGPSANSQDSCIGVEIEGEGDDQHLELKGEPGDYVQSGLFTSGVVDLGENLILTVVSWGSQEPPPTSVDTEPPSPKTVSVRSHNQPPAFNSKDQAWQSGDLPSENDPVWGGTVHEKTFDSDSDWNSGIHDKTFAESGELKLEYGPVYYFGQMNTSIAVSLGIHGSTFAQRIVLENEVYCDSVEYHSAGGCGVYDGSWIHFCSDDGGEPGEIIASASHDHSQGGWLKCPVNQLLQPGVYWIKCGGGGKACERFLYFGPSGSYPEPCYQWIDNQWIEVEKKLAFKFNKLAFQGTGVWTCRHDSGIDNFEWSELRFQENKPLGTETSYQVRTADSEQGLANAEWYPEDGFHETPSRFVKRGRWIEFKIRLSTSDDTITPSVQLLSSKGCLLSLPWTEIENGYAVPENMRNRYVQFRLTLWRGE